MSGRLCGLSGPATITGGQLGGLSDPATITGSHLKDSGCPYDTRGFRREGYSTPAIIMSLLAINIIGAARHNDTRPTDCEETSAIGSIKPAGALSSTGHGGKLAATAA